MVNQGVIADRPESAIPVITVVTIDPGTGLIGETVQSRTMPAVITSLPLQDKTTDDGMAKRSLANEVTEAQSHHHARTVYMKLRKPSRAISATLRLDLEHDRWLDYDSAACLPPKAL